MPKKPYAIIVGANGGIGNALCNQLSESHHVIAITRTAKITDIPCDVIHADFLNDDIEACVHRLKEYDQLTENLDIIVIATGVLHSDKLDIRPEKRSKSLRLETMQNIFEINTFLPTLVLKTLIPLCSRKRPIKCVVTSARVGSISDNKIGGWHSYRASKAALNMYIKTLAIELSNSHPELKLFSYHPGTVDTELSKPFSKNTPQEKLFSPTQAAQYLLSVAKNSPAYKSGDFIDWKGNIINP